MVAILDFHNTNRQYLNYPQLNYPWYSPYVSHNLDDCSSDDVYRCCRCFSGVWRRHVLRPRAGGVCLVPARRLPERGGPVLVQALSDRHCECGAGRHQCHSVCRYAGERYRLALLTLSSLSARLGVIILVSDLIPVMLHRFQFNVNNTNPKYNFFIINI